MAFIIVGNYCALTYFFESELKLPSVIDMSQSFILFLFLFFFLFFFLIFQDFISSKLSASNTQLDYNAVYLISHRFKQEPIVRLLSYVVYHS